MIIPSFRHLEPLFPGSSILLVDLGGEELVMLGSIVWDPLKSEATGSLVIMCPRLYTA